jgi:hypothetical protein
LGVSPHEARPLKTNWFLSRLFHLRVGAAAGALVLAAAACASSGTRGSPQAADGAASRFVLQSVDGDPLPASIQLPFPKLEPALSVRRAEVEFLPSDSATLFVQLRQERCVALPPASGQAGCVEVHRPSQQRHRLRYSNAGERIVLIWEAWPTGEVDSAHGTLRGDTLRLAMPFHQVHWLTKKDYIWTQEFLFVRR